MKRHVALSPLSREHHGALILAQLLKKGAPVYKGLPSDIGGKAKYAFQYYQEELVKHFDDEEQAVINNIKGINGDLDKMAIEIVREHEELKILFSSVNQTNDLASHLDKLGHALEQHIRKEERFFFPMIQESCSEKLLQEIERALSV